MFFVKPRGEGEPELPADRPKPAAVEPGKQKVPTSEMHLTEWTFVPWALRDHLAELCLPEKWYYGDQPEPGKELSILNNYLDNTFRRLCYEGKVVIRVDPANGEEYAAFMAYTDSRLVARPDSDWLRTDDIHNSAPDLAEV